MKQMRIHDSRWALSLLSAILLCGCSYDRKSEEYSALATVMPTYSSINAQIIQPKCMTCHGPGGEAENIDFTTYAGVYRNVKPGKAESSRIYNEVESGDMPQYRPQLSDDEILAIYQWIQNGAPND
jgi:mono/diheme cytochrome c family protein